eukprot:6193394-Pleurochrysis_carterae.AAC.1
MGASAWAKATETAPKLACVDQQKKLSSNPRIVQERGREQLWRQRTNERRLLRRFQTRRRLRPDGVATGEALEPHVAEQGAEVDGRAGGRRAQLQRAVAATHCAEGKRGVGDEALTARAEHVEVRGGRVDREADERRVRHGHVTNDGIVVPLGAKAVTLHHARGASPTLAPYGAAGRQALVTYALLGGLRRAVAHGAPLRPNRRSGHLSAE